MPITPWRISAKVKADPAAARLEQLEVSYGAEDRALKFSGVGDIRFGASPLLRAALSARQLDADRFAAKDSKDNRRAEPLRVLPALARADGGDSAARRSRRRSNSAPSRSCWAAVRCRILPPSCRPTPNPGRIERLDFRAPGATPLSAERRQCAKPVRPMLKGALSVEFVRSGYAGGVAAGPQRDQSIAARSRCGCAAMSPWRRSRRIEAMKAEIDGGAVEGRVALSNPREPAARGSMPS